MKNCLISRDNLNLHILENIFEKKSLMIHGMSRILADLKNLHLNWNNLRWMNNSE